MRIEIVRQPTPIDRERYEFRIELVSKGIYIHLIKYVAERKKSTRHRIYTPLKAWSTIVPRTFGHNDVLIAKPPVPIDVMNELTRKVNNAVHVEFTVAS